MSVMLATTNPEAARRAVPRPMPEPGDVVTYHLRPGEMRAGRTSVPAFVLAADEDNRLLTIMVIYDHQDMMTLERVPERVGSDQGWVARGGPDAAVIAALREEIAGLNARLQSFMDEMSDCLFGKHGKPDGDYESRLLALEAAMAKAKKAK